MVEERGGWFVKNVRDARWVESPQFGKRCIFEGDEPFPQIGVGVHVIEPGQSNCRYHREEAQEDFLVLAGECVLLVNGEERPLKQWDFVHCPAGVSHVFVGAGDAPCAIVMLGARPAELFYPHDAIAAKHGVQVAEPTHDPRVAYADAMQRTECEPSEIF